MHPFRQEDFDERELSRQDSSGSEWRGKERRDPRDARDARDLRDLERDRFRERDLRDLHGRDPRDARDARDRDVRDRDPRDQRDSRERDSRDQRDLRDRDRRGGGRDDPRDNRDRLSDRERDRLGERDREMFRDDRPQRPDSRDSRDSRASRESRNSRDSARGPEDMVAKMETSANWAEASFDPHYEKDKKHRDFYRDRRDGPVVSWSQVCTDPPKTLRRPVKTSASVPAHVPGPITQDKLRAVERLYQATVPMQRLSKPPTPNPASVPALDPTPAPVKPVDDQVLPEPLPARPPLLGAYTRLHPISVPGREGRPQG